MLVPKIRYMNMLFPLSFFVWYSWTNALFVIHSRRNNVKLFGFRVEFITLLQYKN